MMRVPRLLLRLLLLLVLLLLILLLLLLLLRREHFDDVWGRLHAVTVLLIHRLLYKHPYTQNIYYVSFTGSCAVYLFMHYMLSERVNCCHRMKRCVLVSRPLHTRPTLCQSGLVVHKFRNNIFSKQEMDPLT